MALPPGTAAWLTSGMSRAEQERAGAPITGTVRSLRWLVLGLLVTSALTALFVLPALDQAVADGRLPKAILLIPAALLALVVVAYAVHRYLLVRAGRYGAGKALVQLGLLVLMVGIVGGASLDRYRAARVAAPVDLARALASTDPVTRALAAEVVRHRPRGEGLPHAERLVTLLEDPSSEVRTQAHRSLVSLLGTDAGGGPDAPQRWRAALRARDDLPH
jgi:hypothetical protein